MDEKGRGGKTERDNNQLQISIDMISEVQADDAKPDSDESTGHKKNLQQQYFTAAMNDID